MRADHSAKESPGGGVSVGVKLPSTEALRKRLYSCGLGVPSFSCVGNCKLT